MATHTFNRIGARIERQESPLGSWVSARWSPAPNSQLHGVVERIWYFAGTLAHARERVFPDGSAEVIVMLDEPHRDGDTAALELFPAVCINGIRTRPSVVVAPRGHCRVLGIRFDPIGACRLLRESMIHLMDVTVALEQSLGRAAEKLGERCAAAASSHSSNDMANAGAILDVTIGWLLEHLTGQSEADPAVSWMAGAIRGAGGVVSVDEIGSKLSIPRSRLSRRFCHFVGVTPKRYARIIRFHRALGSISRGQAIAAVAADLGYYDQAHLYRDFSEFAGMTPGAFIAATRYPAGVSLAEP